MKKKKLLINYVNYNLTILISERNGSMNITGRQKSYGKGN